VAQRIVRTKAKIRETPIPVRVPTPQELPERAAIPANADSAVEIKVWWRIVREKAGYVPSVPHIGNQERLLPTHQMVFSTMEVLWTLPPIPMRPTSTRMNSYEFACLLSLRGKETGMRIDRHFPETGENLLIELTAFVSLLLVLIKVIMTEAHQLFR